MNTGTHCVAGSAHPMVRYTLRRCGSSYVAPACMSASQTKWALANDRHLVHTTGRRLAPSGIALQGPCYGALGSSLDSYGNLLPAVLAWAYPGRRPA
jgi:hypothetical protein